MLEIFAIYGRFAGDRIHFNDFMCFFNIHLIELQIYFCLENVLRIVSSKKEYYWQRSIIVLHSRDFSPIILETLCKTRYYLEDVVTLWVYLGKISRNRWKNIRKHWKCVAEWKPFDNSANSSEISNSCVYDPVFSENNI